MAPLTIELNGTGTKSICARARDLVAEGENPERMVRWLRGGADAFTATYPLGWWASRMVREGAYVSVRITPYHPIKGGDLT